MLRGLFLLLLGFITGFLFTLTYTGLLLRDNIILAQDELQYKIPCKIEMKLEEYDWKLREYLIQKFPELNPVQEGRELK